MNTLNKQDTNSIREIIGQEDSVNATVRFRCGEIHQCVISKINGVKYPDNLEHFNFSWNGGDCNVSTDGAGMRYTSESAYDVMAISTRLDIYLTEAMNAMSAVDAEFTDTTKKAYHEVFKIVNNNGNILDLQNKDCEAIYTHVFNEHTGRNEEFRVIGLVITGRSLYAVTVLASDEDDIKRPYTKAELLHAFSNGTDRYLMCVRCDSTDMSQTELFSQLAKHLYPYLIP